MILKDEKKYWCYFFINRNVKNLIKNIFLVIKILIKEWLDLIVSSGVVFVILFFYFGKLLGVKVVYIEVYDRIDKLIIIGRVVYLIMDLFVL